jgi:hypothetical protein
VGFHIRINFPIREVHCPVAGLTQLSTVIRGRVSYGILRFGTPGWRQALGPRPFLLAIYRFIGKFPEILNKNHVARENYR